MSNALRLAASLAALTAAAMPASATTIIISFAGQTANGVTEDMVDSDGGTSVVTGSIRIDTAALVDAGASPDESYHYETTEAPFLMTTLTFTGGTAPAFGGTASINNVLRGLFGANGYYEIDDNRTAQADAAAVQTSNLALVYDGNVAPQTVDGFVLPTFAVGQTLGINAQSSRMQASGTPSQRNVTAVGQVTITAVANGVAAVPEPATWATMVLGFGLAGAAVRRRARAVA